MFATRKKPFKLKKPDADWKNQYEFDSLMRGLFDDDGARWDHLSKLEKLAHQRGKALNLLLAAARANQHKQMTDQEFLDLLKNEYPTTTVELWSDLDRPCIIVKANTGVYYTNQTGGVCCNHPTVEGYLLNERCADSDVYDPSTWYMTDRTANQPQVHRKIEKSWNLERSNIRNLKVDKRADNMEAWVHVTFEIREPNTYGENAKWNKREGVLTWVNCD